VRVVDGGQDCELILTGNLDREETKLWNITIGVREITRNKRETEFVPGKGFLAFLLIS